MEVIKINSFLKSLEIIIYYFTDYKYLAIEYHNYFNNNFAFTLAKNLSKDYFDIKSYFREIIDSFKGCKYFIIINFRIKFL